MKISRTNNFSCKMISLLILFIMLLWCNFMPAAQATNAFKNNSLETLRVGYWPRQNRFEENRFGKLEGYDVEFLKQVALRGNFKINFIPTKSPDEALEALSLGNVDMVTSVIRTENRTQDFLFSDLSIGLYYSSLIAPKDLDVNFLDTNKINPLKIGYMGDYGKSGLDAIHVKTTYPKAELFQFDSVASMRQAIANGNIQAMVTGRYSLQKTDKVLDIFSPSEFFFITNKNNPVLMEKLNQTVADIVIENPSFFTDLQKNYLPEYTQNQYSQEELDYFKNNKVFKVAIPEARIPIAWFDKETNSPQGIFIDILAEVARENDIVFEYYPLPEKDFLNNALKENKYDLIMPVFNDCIAKFGLLGSNPILKASASLGVMKNQAPSYTSTLRIGVSESCYGLEHIFYKQFPNASILSFRDQDSMLTALKKGDIDAIANIAPIWSYLFKNPKYEDVMIFPTDNVHLNVYIASGKKDIPPVLLAAINTAISRISSNHINSIISSYATRDLYKPTLAEYLTYNWNIVLIALLLVIMFGFLIYFIALKKNNAKIQAMNDRLIENNNELQLKEATIHSIAYTDSLTKLANRSALFDRCSHYIERSIPCSLIMMDLDNFKQINDNFGHHYGDQFLTTIASRFQLLFHEELLNDNVFVARFGGDQFAILIKDTEISVLEKIINEVKAFLKHPIIIENKSFYLTATFGVSRYPMDAETPSDLLVMSDIAMYQTKKDNNGNYALFDESFLAGNSLKNNIAEILNDALTNDKIYLVYQPQIFLKDGSMKGVEALLRVKDVNVNTSHLIKVAEFTGLIQEIGRLVTKMAIKQLAEWRAKGLDITMSINFSSKQILDPTFTDYLEELLDEYKIPPNKIVLEITETIFLKKTPLVTNILNKWHSLGLLIALDDFAMENSSLKYLSFVPVTYIKLDRSFVTDFLNQQSYYTIKSIIDLSHSLDAKIIAEGVETADEVELLKECQCDFIQGYFFSKPILPDEFWDKYGQKDS